MAHPEGYDPTKPYTWTGDQRISALDDAGFTWVGGEGPSARWRGPDGQVTSELNALNDAIFGPETKKEAKPPALPNIQYDAQGRAFYWTNEYGDTPVKQFDPSLDDPRKAVGYQAPASGGSGASTALGYAQLEQNAKQWQASFDQATQAAAQVHADKMAELQQAGMINLYNIAFNDKKQAFAEASDNKHLALQSQQMQQDLAFKQADIQLKQQTLDYQYATFNATAQNEAAKFNAQMSLQTQQANQQFESQRQDRLANIATQAGQLAQNPGDIGKLAATLTANSGWGQANAVTSGQDYRTDQSKTPLESLLRTRQDVQNQQSPYQYNPVQAQQLAPPTLAGMMGGRGFTNPDGTIDPMSVRSAQQAGATPVAGQSASQGFYDQQAAAAAASQGQTPVKGPQAAAGGGVLSSALRKVGERGPELQIDLADGRTMVLNAQQQSALAKAGLDLTEGAQGYASGGLFDNAFSNVQDSNRDLSTGFLNDAYSRAVSGTPWANQKQLPSPVWLSSPGTNPLTAQLVGSLKALGEGVPADTTSYLANLYKPVGAREMVTGRTR